MLGNNSFFVAGAIPSILWVLVISIVNNYILMPWAAVFGLTVPDVSLPGEVWTLAGWIITGLLAKKAFDGNEIYSKTGVLLKPAKTDIAEKKPPPMPPRVNQNEIVRDQDYYDRRFEELTNKYPDK